MVRKQSKFNTISIFRLYYKVKGKYNPNDYANFLARNAKKINDINVIKQIDSFIEINKYTNFNSILEIEEYFTFCFMKNLPLYFFNLNQYIDDWKKYKLTDTKQELKYIFSDKIIDYLKKHKLTFKEYLKPQKGYIPRILQHYLMNKEIPFEVILYLKVLDHCELDKKKLKLLLSSEIYEMNLYEKRLERLIPLIQSELKIILGREK